ncbi:MAG TPA: tetratricopeptide repeat protein [Mycobacteriales bacterium]|nr:tetratricopeptide repeat protein [Mycobacteriales bacterium]
MLPHAPLAAALRAAAGPDETAAILDEAGDRILAAGHVQTILDAVDRLPAAARTPHRLVLLAHARQLRGDADGALVACGLAAPDGPLSPAVAWRMGLVHYQAGDPTTALAVYGRARRDGTDPVAEAHLLAWSANAHWMLGDPAAARQQAERAHDTATASGDPGALAAAHAALAFSAMLAGDRRGNGRHWALATEAAERAGDVLQLLRIRANHGSHLVEEGFPADALAELEPAALLAEQVGYAVAVGLCRTNLGQCLLQLGRIGAAVAEFERAKATFQAIGGRLIAYPLTGLGDAYRERGDLALARAAYEEAVASGAPEDPQGWVGATTGLARVLAVDDPAAAEALAAEAVRVAREPERHRAELTLGWLRLAAGAHGEALTLAGRVSTAARGRRDRAALAEALELTALSDRDADGRPDPRAGWLLDEALSVWQEIGHQVSVQRVRYARWRLFGAATADPGAAAALEQLGVRVPGPHGAGLLDTVHRCAPLRVAIRVLGRFEVTRGGIPVADTEWQSRKARELLKILLARRGRAVPRSRLVELLWPDEEGGPDAAAVLGNRLSVALATVRRVLDPVRAQPAGHYLITEDGSVALALHRIDVDVLTFLRDATDGLRTRSVPVLRRAAGTYRGDVLEEDVYADWTHDLREEARAACLAVLRALAADTTDTDEAVLALLRLLEHDRYDEPAHLALIQVLLPAGRWGDAVRAHRCYRARMAEIGVEPAPVPGLPGGGVPLMTPPPVPAGLRRSPGTR